jgi:selenocysteine-specific elongation factor
MRESSHRGPLTIGTAGHVDHGKTALVRALTGVDTDRLAEEKARGLSIELGFAPLQLPSRRPASIVDVPGHERFIRTMVAGASGIDLFLMVVSADEGVQAQTVEHAAALRALGVERGVVAITKADRADPQAAARGAAELLAGCVVVPCSARTGRGLGELLAALDATGSSIGGRSSVAGPAALHIDRSFAVAGHGTVVTGTLASGTVAPGDRLVLEPAGRRVRIRAVEVHGERRERAVAGQRVAVNLPHVAADSIARGDAIGAPGALCAAHTVAVAPDAALAAALEHAARSIPVTVHHGTAVAAARLSAVGPQNTSVRLRCRRALLVRAGDAVVIRAGAPLRILGGGRVVATPTRPAEPRRRAEVAPTAASPAALGPPSPAALELARELQAAGLRPPSDDALGARAELLDELVSHGLAVRLCHGRHAGLEAVAEVRRIALELSDADGHVELPRLRDATGGSRAQAKAFLDYLDGTGFTRRRRDGTRVLRGAS